MASYLLFWLDDVLLYSSSVDNLFHAIRIFIQFFVERNLRLHPSNFMLYATSVRWFGRSISADGTTYDPARSNGLLEMEPPTNGAHLQQFLCALHWVKNCVPAFRDLVEPPISSWNKSMTGPKSAVKRPSAAFILSIKNGRPYVIRHSKPASMPSKTRSRWLIATSPSAYPCTRLLPTSSGREFSLSCRSTTFIFHISRRAAILSPSCQDDSTSKSFVGLLLKSGIHCTRHLGADALAGCYERWF